MKKKSGSSSGSPAASSKNSSGPRSSPQQGKSPVRKVSQEDRPAALRVAVREDGVVVLVVSSDLQDKDRNGQFTCLLPIEVLQALKLRIGDCVVVRSIKCGHSIVAHASINMNFDPALSSSIIVSKSIIDYLELSTNESVEVSSFNYLRQSTSYTEIYKEIQLSSISFSLEDMTQFDLVDTETSKSLVQSVLLGRGPLILSAKQIADAMFPNITVSILSELVKLKIEAIYSEDEEFMKGSKVNYFVCYLTNETTTQLIRQKKEEQQSNTDEILLSAIGGLQEQIETVKKIVESSLRTKGMSSEDKKRSEVFAKFGIRPARGVLLYGPPGTGKTLLARMVAKTCGASLFVINAAAEIVSKYYGDAESKLKKLFEKAIASMPSLIFLDEIDSLAPKRDDPSTTESERRTVACLLSCIDMIPPDGGVVVIAATNRPNSIDPGLRRPGRFDREVEIGIPNELGRREILSVYLSKIPNDLSADDIYHIASITHGYVGADIAALCREAMAFAIASKRDSNNILVSRKDLSLAMADVRPSVMREVAVEVPRVYWEEVGGQEHIKQKLKEAVEWPLKHPEVFTRMGIRPPKGILLYGPPGCSKTLMAKALATEAGLNFIAVKGPELFSRWVGESERAVRELFKRARAASPSIIFFDEIDALAVKRGANGEGSNVGERVLSQLLTEMDGIENDSSKSVTILAATNRPDSLDKALIRPGRIDRILFVGPPNSSARLEILRINLKKVPTSLTDDNLQYLVEKTEQFSGAEVVALCREASLAAMRENVHAEMVHMKHFEQALSGIKPQITKAMIAFYDHFRQTSKLQNLG